MSSISKLPIISEIKKKIESKQYESAIELLENSTELPQNIKLYNLGFLHYKNKNFVKSKKYYEQARLEGMFTKELSQSLKEVNKELQISSVEAQYTTYETFLFNYLLLPPTQLALIYSSLILFTLVSIFRRWIIFGILTFATLIFFAGHAYWVKDYELVYNKKEIFLFSGPSAIFEEIGVLPPGAKLISGKTKYDWQHIEYPELFKGWIKKEENEL